MKANLDSASLNSSLSALDAWLKDCPTPPTVGVVLGSGLGHAAEDLLDARSIGYEELGFPTPHVIGHAGKLCSAMVGDQHALFLSGRVHSYEGHDFQTIVHAVRTLALSGIKKFILTCAAGAINRDYHVGQIVAIRDHINFSLRSPLTGINDEKYGTRFPDMTQAYDWDFRATAHTAVLRLTGKHLAEGVYAMMPGPQFETPSEIQMLRMLGADLVGMSTVPEVIALRHLGAHVLALACVTNPAADSANKPIKHEDVATVAQGNSQHFKQLLLNIIAEL